MICMLVIMVEIEWIDLLLLFGYIVVWVMIAMLLGLLLYGYHFSIRMCLVNVLFENMYLLGEEIYLFL